MELTVLGSSGTWPRMGGACSGYLVRHDGFTLWIDLGSGTFANLQRYIHPLDVDAVIVSHSHADHVVDLFPYFYARHYAMGEPQGTPLFWPPGVYARVGSLLSEETLQDLGTSFLLTDVRPGDGFDVGPFVVTTAPMAHPVPTLGVRLEAGGVSLTYTADSGPTPEVPQLARGTDLLLADATWQGDGSEYPPDIHMTAGEVGEAAAKADVGRLILTHIWPTLDLDRSKEEASAAYDGAIETAFDNMHVAVKG